MIINIFFWIFSQIQAHLVHCDWLLFSLPPDPPFPDPFPSDLLPPFPDPFPSDLLPPFPDDLLPFLLPHPLPPHVVGLDEGSSVGLAVGVMLGDAIGDAVGETLVELEVKF